MIVVIGLLLFVIGQVLLFGDLANLSKDACAGILFLTLASWCFVLSILESFVQKNNQPKNERTDSHA